MLSSQDLGCPEPNWNEVGLARASGYLAVTGSREGLVTETADPARDDGERFFKGHRQR